LSKSNGERENRKGREEAYVTEIEERKERANDTQLLIKKTPNQLHMYRWVGKSSRKEKK
jgi:hypothetical protein